MWIRLLILATPFLVSACAAPAPLAVVGAGAYEVAKYEENLRLRAAAALHDEPNLLTFSIKAIAQGNTEKAVETYLLGYNDPDFTDDMKSLALYQISLIYMNRFNDQRDDAKAREYFARHQREFPNSRLASRLQSHLAVLNNRAKNPVFIPAKELLNHLNREKLLSQPDLPYEDELNPMSKRAISTNRTADAETVYTIVYENKASGDEIRAKALYQMGLIYMSVYNKDKNHPKALDYFRTILDEFPSVSIRSNVELRITELINAQ